MNIKTLIVNVKIINLIYILITNLKNMKWKVSLIKRRKIIKNEIGKKTIKILIWKVRTIIGNL